MQTACILRRRSNRIRVYKDLPRLLIVLAAVFIAMEGLYWYNPYNNFLGMRASAAWMTAFCCLSFVQSARAILCERRLSGTAVKKQGRGDGPCPVPP